MWNFSFIVRKVALFLILMLLGFSSFAQYSIGGTPYSLREKSQGINNINKIEKKTLPPVNVDSVKQAEKALQNSSEKPIPPRFGVSLDVNYNPENAGNWQKLSNGGRIWRLKIHSPGAKSLNFIFDNYYLPKGARLYIFNPKENHVLGAFTHKNNKKSGKFATDLLKGETAIIEYYEQPFGRNGEFSISKVTHGYKNDSSSSNQLGEGESAPCNNDVNCSVADDWCVEKRSVGMILLADNTRWCSGALLNNTNNNNRLLFLTADHCLESSSGGEIDPSTLVFRFFYWSIDCNSENSVNDFISLSGSNVLAQRDVSKSKHGTDFALLEITEPRPEGISLHFMGWNKTKTTPDDGYGIHHPSGDMMKYSFADNVDKKTSFWKVVPWLDGTTEKGSSGSPLFNSNHKVVGQLYSIHPGCGYSCCIGKDERSHYGRLDRSWQYDGLGDELAPSNNNSPDKIGHHASPVYLINRTISPNDEHEYAAFNELRIGGEVPTNGNNCQPSGQKFIVENGANAIFKAGNEVHIDGGTIIRGGNNGPVTIETGDINCNVRLARGDFVSGPCNAQVNFKRAPTSSSESEDTNPKNNNVTIYPNPVKKTLSIEKKNFKDRGLNYKLLTIDGQPVKTGEFNQQHESIEIGSLASGVYLIRIYSGGNQVKTKKVVVQ